MTLKANRDPLLTPWADRKNEPETGKEMTLAEAIGILERHQWRWRGDDSVTMPKPEELGEAFDKVIHAAKCYEMIIRITNVAYEKK